MANYSFEKGKYGGYVGCIFPYFRTLSTDQPLDTEYIENIPAGYLKCKGQILNADQYPNLATILGVGDTSIYKKSGITLQNRDANGNGGQIQLPDLGSKFITASSTPGGYLNTTTLNPLTNSEILRAGVEVILTSNAQNNLITFSYDGDFVLPETNIPISGSILTTASSSTPASEVYSTQVLAHGHNTSVSTGERIATAEAWVSQAGVRQFLCLNPTPQGQPIAPTGLEWTTNNMLEAGDQTTTSHRHGGIFPAVSWDRTQTTGTMRRTLIPADSLTTSVRLNTDTTFKLDYIAPKFILCEYLIKF